MVTLHGFTAVLIAVNLLQDEFPSIQKNCAFLWHHNGLYFNYSGYTRKNATDLLQPVAPSDLIQV